jgi:hypothetical protein
MFLIYFEREKMTFEQAKKILGNRALWEIKAMIKALSLHSWLNTDEENERLLACKIYLKGKK